MKRPQDDEPIALRCYAYLKGNLVYAECIDLDIMVVRPTFAQSRDALKGAIEGTLDVAAEDGILEEILRRKSPWPHRLRYHWFRFRTWFRRLRGGEDGTIRPSAFNCPMRMPCHA